MEQLASFLNLIEQDLGTEVREGERAPEGTELGLRSRRRRGIAALRVNALKEPFNRSNQQSPAETPGDGIGLLEEFSSLLDISSLQVETAYIHERPGIIGEVPSLLELAQTPLP